MHLNYFTQDSSFPFFIQYGYHDHDFDMHHHVDFSELVIVMNGTAMHQVDTNSYFIKKGDVFVIGEDIYHGYTSTNQLQICNIMFQPKMLLESEYDIRKLPGFHALFVLEPYLTKKHEFQSRLSLNLQQFEEIHSHTDIMLREYNSHEPGRNTMLFSYFMVLVTLLSRLYTLPSQNTETNALNIAKSVSYIENNFTESVTIDALAEISHLSTRHFTRLFTASYHITPGNYILSLRMQYACQLLKNTSETISEIAILTGYGDSNYFSRQFHKFSGMSPREYRNKYILENL